MRRLTISVWMICTMAFTSIFFQNCGQYKPELNLSDSYLVKSESATDTPEDPTLVTEIQNITIITETESNTYSQNDFFSIAFSIPNERLAQSASFHCRVDGNDWQLCQSPFQLNNIEDGHHVVAIKAVYKKHESRIKEIVWTKDTLEPDLVFNRVPPNYVGTQNIEISFSGTDKGSGIKEYQCLLDQQDVWTACQSPLVYTDLSTGAHTVSIRALDNANNVTEITKNWNIDLTYPFIELTAAPSEFVKTNEAHFEFQAKNNTDFNFFECQFNKATDFSPCDRFVTYPLEEDGIHTFRVRAKNSEGYYTSTLTYIFTRDTSGPLIEIISPKSKVLIDDPDQTAKTTELTGSFIIVANITDGVSGSGVASVNCVIESVIMFKKTTRTITKCQFPLDLSSEGYGTHTVTIVATDKMGNVSSSNALSINYADILLTPLVK